MGFVSGLMNKKKRARKIVILFYKQCRHFCYWKKEDERDGFEMARLNGECIHCKRFYYDYDEFWTHLCE